MKWHAIFVGLVSVIPAGVEVVSAIPCTAVTGTGGIVEKPFVILKLVPTPLPVDAASVCSCASNPSACGAVIVVLEAPSGSTLAVRSIPLKKKPCKFGVVPELSRVGSSGYSLTFIVMPVHGSQSLSGRLPVNENQGSTAPTGTSPEVPAAETVLT